MNGNWRPSAAIEVLRERARILASIRYFFQQRDLLEVETPLLMSATGTDPYIQSLEVLINSKEKFYLQTSPELAMKRLLAAGSGSIYQIGKSFRGFEKGRYHNPEFTMLEWYHIGFNHHQLMDEVDELIQRILSSKPAQRMSYQQAFEHYIGINPHRASAAELEKVFQQKNKIPQNIDRTDKDVWLQLLMTEKIEPHLGKKGPTFIYDYPSSQAALARLRSEKDYAVAERFELYVQGIELANGFHELSDAREQRRRFTQELEKRKQLGYPPVKIDQFFLEALEQGLPECAGVAVGIDRLVMLALKKDSIDQVISFNIERV